ncbi:MAG: flagellar basal-body MS-ring/collar protein FliF [Deltaproteobacteria bacterium]|jgi:flagellar M-ring protein FliF
MKTLIEQFVSVFKALPNSQKVSMAVVLGLVAAGFALMFFWANQVDYQLLYSNLSQEDAGNIVSKLREQRIPYKLAGGGEAILVPADKVYELRLAMANNGLPSGGHVGFEIFDHSDFSTTEFVQRMNYQRALQGELVRTISEFREVEHARVLVVMPKDSLFVEDSKPPTASVLLELRSTLSSDKVAGIVHLVASAVEGLDPDQVTVVDTNGRVLFKGPNQADQAALFSSTKLDYQREIEGQIAGRVQSLLEGIVGKDKAIVRVSSDIDFDQVDVSEEKYDPDSSVVRSRQRKSESSEKGAPNTSEALVTELDQGATAVQGASGTRAQTQKQEEVVNYEMNRVTRHVMKPSGTIKRLSVAAVVDGTYEVVTAEDGAETKKYVPRSPEELQEFEEIVKRAMGFDGDRGDQVYVSSLSLSMSPGLTQASAEKGIDWLGFGRRYLKTGLNLVLIILVFLFVVRPLVKSVKGIGTGLGGQRQLPVSQGGGEAGTLPEPQMDIRQKTAMLAKNNTGQTEQLLRGWLNEEK